MLLDLSANIKHSKVFKQTELKRFEEQTLPYKTIPTFKEHEVRKSNLQI